MGCAEDCAWLRGERSWYPLDDPARKSCLPTQPVKGQVFANDWDKVKEIWTGDDGKIWRFLGKPGGQHVKHVSRNHSGAIDTIKVKHISGGYSTLRFDTVQSFKSNPMGSESSDWDFLHVDEPCPEPMFKAQARGLVDRGGFAWFTLTPLAEPWISDAFLPGGAFDGISFKVEGAMDDNIYLSKSDIADYDRTLTDDERECRRYGKPHHLTGLIYKEFQADKHVLQTVPKQWRDFSTPPKDWPHYFYIDPHPQTPHLVLFVVADPFGKRYYYHDIFEHCSIAHLAAKIREQLKDCFVVHGRIDPLAYINDPITETNMAEEFALHGVFVEKATKALEQGILRVQGELAKDPPQIYFSPNCRRTLWEIQRYHWNEQTNRPVDKDDHAMECLYRAELDEPAWVQRGRWNVEVSDIIIDRTPTLTLNDLVFST
jgi:hypothetical protein